MKPLRALIIAEKMSPEGTSGALIGWSHARAIAARMPTHIVTHVRWKDSLERAGVGASEVTFIDVEKTYARARWAARLFRGEGKQGWTTVRAFETFAYRKFEAEVWRVFGGAIERREFDIVHRITPLSPTTPSALAGKCARAGAPFIWGPINGGLPWPREFGHLRKQEKEWLGYVRGAYRLMPGYLSTRRHAAAILVGSRSTLADMPARWRGKCVYEPENAVDMSRFPEPGPRAPSKTLRIMFVGRLVALKGVDMALGAAAGLLREGRATFTIVGVGPEEQRLRAQAASLGVGAGVRFLQWVEHARLHETLREGDVFVFPSVHDFGGGAVTEAMAMGLAPVVVDWGGPGELVSPACGALIPMGPRASIVEALRQELERFAADPGLAAVMGRRARERILHAFTWDARAAQTLQVYDWATGRRAEKPDFGMPLADPAWDEGRRGVGGASPGGERERRTGAIA